jgi:hypothetical protein
MTHNSQPDLVFVHGQRRATRPSFDMPVHIVEAHKVTDPTSTKIMLLLGEGAGHHTEMLDLVDIDAWLMEHHPEVYSRDADGTLNFYLEGLSPQVLAPCLEHCRAKRREQQGGKTQAIEFGHLIDDASRPFLGYATGVPWKHFSGVMCFGFAKKRS